MKKIINSKYLLPLFLIILFIINLIQGYTTELIADEAYYWTYSNELDWGYFDHPPMVAVWITISKFFFSEGELSVRFFSAITLSITYFIIWLLIDHKEKKTFTWLYLLIISSTALFTVYGFITVPDTPLILFYALFLLGYKKYLSEKSLLSYLLLAISMAGMLYSKYQGVLIIFFVLLSNLKVLKDYKIWITSIVTILLFSPHLYWQFDNNFPSFKYHLLERSSRRYRIDFTTNHFLNLIAIIGFTFPIVYTAFYKRFKVKNPFEKALRYIVLGFAIFFFFSSFKNHVQAQWILPISVSLIIITFYFLIENKRFLKSFKILAFITILFVCILRFVMINDGILPKQFEMHGNKKWVAALEKKVGNKTPLFLNSYQNTSTYWFYSGKRPYQYNSWNSRKNQYDLYSFNQNFNIDNVIEIGTHKKDAPTDSVTKRNKGKTFLRSFKNNYIKNNLVIFEINPTKLKENTINNIPVKYDSSKINSYNIKITISVVLKSKYDIAIHQAELKDNNIIVNLPKFKSNFKPTQFYIVGTYNIESNPIRLSTLKNILK